MSCAVTEEGQLPLLTLFQTWSWTGKRGFATQTRWSATNTLVENGSLESRFHLWRQKQARGKGLLQAVLLRNATSYHVKEDTISDVRTKVEAIQSAEFRTTPASLQPPCGRVRLPNVLHTRWQENYHVSSMTYRNVPTYTIMTFRTVRRKSAPSMHMISYIQNVPVGMCQTSGGCSLC
jgi:hypothetical protein